MAISVTTDLVTITNADSTTASGTFYRLNGTSSANPAQDLDAFVQGNACVANKMGATSGTTDTGGHFNHTTTFDLTNQHIFHWRQIVTAGNMLTKANRGICLGLTNTSITSNTTWSTTNYKLWFLDGSDTVKAAEGWKCYVVDPTSTADVSAGALTLTTVKNVGFICRQNSGVTTTVSNQFVDAVRSGTGLTATTSAGTDVITMVDIYNVDSTTANMWGIVTQSAGLYFGAGKINIGASGQTNACNFVDSGQVFVWRNFPVSNTLYAFNLIGNATHTTTMDITSWVVRGQNDKTWDIVCGTGSRFIATSCAFANIRTATLSSTSSIDSCTIEDSGTIEVNGATITATTFTNHIATQLKVDSSSEMSSISNCTFNSSGTGHAIEITAPGTYTFSAIDFIDYGATGTTNAAVYNNSGGAVTINVSGGGGSPTYRNGTGASTSVNASANVTLTGLKSDSEVRAYVGTDPATATEIAGTESSGTSFNFSQSNAGSAGYIQIFHVDYQPVLINLTYSSSDASIPVQQASDRQYSRGTVFTPG